ncbi:MAG: molybdenum cofactor biosynthesis protein B [Mycoplasmatales bacterium]
MNCVVITVSDKGSQGLREDTAGPAVSNLLEQNDYQVLENSIIPDDFDLIVNTLEEYVSKDINLILTVGGTGYSKRDVTPEATNKVVTRLTPGLNETMRYQSSKVTNRAMLSRASSGIKDNSLIINLPGSKKASVENLKFILPSLKHGLDILLGNDSNCGVEVKK